MKFSVCLSSSGFLPWYLLISHMYLSGYGGGFNERENIEYIEREESDGEYDEVRSQIQLVCENFTI